MGEAAPVKGVPRPNILVTIWWLFAAVTIALIILEVTL
jgi:hypothetical protein